MTPGTPRDGRSGSSYGPPSGGYAARDAARLVFNVSGDFEAAADTLYDPALGLAASISLEAVREWLVARAEALATDAVQEYEALMVVHEFDVWVDERAR